MADNPIKHSEIIQDGNPFDEAIKGIKAMIKLLDKMGKEIKEGATEWSKFAQKQNVTTKQGQDNLKKAAKATAQLTVKEKEALTIKKALEKEQAKLNLMNTKEYKDLIKIKEATKAKNAELRKSAKAMATGTKTTNTWSKAAGSFAAKFNTLGNIAANVASKITQLFVKAAKDAIKIIIDFDQAMADVKAISRATIQEFDKLKKSAMALGGATKFTASEVAGLQKEYAKLGFTAEQIIELQEATLKLAAATDADLGEAALVVGGAIRAYGLEMKDAASVAATLAVATTKSAITFRDYETILSTLGPVARSFGFSLEDTLGLMGELRNANFDTSKAATATRNILLNLADSNGVLAKELGGNVTNMEELVSGLVQLRERGVDLNTTLELTDKRSVAAFNTFINGAENAIVLRDAITDVNTELDIMVEVQMNTLENKMKIMNSAWQGLVLEASSNEEAMKGVKGSMDDVAGSINFVTKNFDKFSKAAKATRVATEYVLVIPAAIRGIRNQLKKLNPEIDETTENVGDLETEFRGLIEGVTITAKKLTEEIPILKSINDKIKEYQDLQLLATTEAQVIGYAKEIKALQDKKSELTTIVNQEEKLKTIQEDKLKALRESLDIREKMKTKDVSDDDFFASMELSDSDIDEALSSASELSDGLKVIEDDLAKSNKTKADKKAQDESDAEAQKKQLIGASIDAAQQASDSLFSYQEKQLDNRYKAELEAAEGNEAAIKEIQERQAKDEQKLAIGKAVVDGALGAAKTISNLGFPAAIPALIAQAVILAGQIATIKSVQFAEGGSGMLDSEGGILQGASHASGGINPRIEAEGGEYFGVINKQMTRRYANELPELFDSINNGRFHDVFSRSNIELNKANIFSDPWNKKIYDRLGKQANVYTDSNGDTVKEYLSGGKRVIRAVGGRTIRRTNIYG